MAETITDLKACPFCGATKLGFSSKKSADVFAPDTAHRVNIYHLSYYCNSCHAYGPRVLLKAPKRMSDAATLHTVEAKQAADLWNARAKDVAAEKKPTMILPGTKVLVVRSEYNSHLGVREKQLCKGTILKVHDTKKGIRYTIEYVYAHVFYDPTKAGRVCKYGAVADFSENTLGRSWYLTEPDLNKKKYIEY